jgi:hypothetical protein
MEDQTVRHVVESGDIGKTGGSLGEQNERGASNRAPKNMIFYKHNDGTGDFFNERGYAITARASSWLKRNRGIGASAILPDALAPVSKNFNAVAGDEDPFATEAGTRAVAAQ